MKINQINKSKPNENNKIIALNERFFGVSNEHLCLLFKSNSLISQTDCIMSPNQHLSN